MRADSDQLVARIEQLIRGQALRSGERLGSERELAERFGVARTALRVALESLESRQLIRRSMGRSGGVFVCDGKIERQLNTIQSVPAMLRQQGVLAHTEVLRLEVGVADPAERRALSLDAGENVFRIVRRRYAAGSPWSLDTSVVPARLAPALMRHDLSGSLYQVLMDHYGIGLADADETIDTVVADAAQAESLEVPLAAPLFQIWRLTRTVTGVPVEFAHDFFRGDRMRIHSRGYGASWKRL